MRRKFSRVEDGIEAIAKGGVVIALDSEDRENEGDFIAAAETLTPATVHFMISQGRGLLCAPVLPDVAQRLQLKPMVSESWEDDSSPRFSVPVDHMSCSTGISPWERAYTIAAMLNPSSRPEDFRRPGHVFPLVARPEGVLRRDGHTEAAVDMARLAGLFPAGVLCEICSRDGLHMANRDELLDLAAEFKIPIITIDDLKAYLRKPSSKPRQAQPENTGGELKKPAVTAS